MFNNYFIIETFKRSVSIFGTLFNNITIKKVQSDGTVLSSQKVPISYGPKQRWLARLEEDAKQRDGNVSAISLPRMAFEISSITYDQSRQQNKLIRSTKTITGQSTNRYYQYTPASYNLGFTLTILSKNVIDALQIVEQILPYFQPEYTVAMKMIDDMDDTRDVPITLDSVELSDSYEGSFDERRVIEYSLTFTMKTYFFGPVSTGNVITSVIERSYLNDENGAFTTTQIDESGLVKKVNSYQPAYAQIAAATSNSTTVLVSDTINTGISVGDEVYGTNLSTPPTVVSAFNDPVTPNAQLGWTLSDAVTIDAGTILKFVGSVDPETTYVITEEATFYDDGALTTFLEDTLSDNT